ncbi:MAG: GGDEF domain-containing protein [Myxococcales bacterium]|nr:GGDEF domain-containing protein [Myxococcales bacterium]
MSNKFKQDDLETTRVSSLEQLKQELAFRSQRDRAYLIVLAGAEVGKMFKLGDGTTTIGRSSRADICVEDDSISRMHVRLTMDGPRVSLEDLESSNGTLVNGDRIQMVELQDGDKIRLGDTTILKFTFHDRLDESFQQRMYDAALRDALTSAFNKKYFVDHLALEISYARRHGTILSLIMFDIDHFKQVNDTHGHVAGDQVLVRLAAVVHALLRNEDVFARYGGEEFCVVLRGIALPDAGRLGERIRSAVETAPFVIEKGSISVTVSVGVAEYRQGSEDPLELVGAADGALYAAKNSGRNRVLLKSD